MNAALTLYLTSNLCTMGVYDSTYLLAAWQPEKDLPWRQSATIGTEHWLPMFEVPMFDLCTLAFQTSTLQTSVL